MNTLCALTRLILRSQGQILAFFTCFKDIGCPKYSPLRNIKSDCLLLVSFDLLDMFCVSHQLFFYYPPKREREREERDTVRTLERPNTKRVLGNFLLNRNTHQFLIKEKASKFNFLKELSTHMYRLK